MGDTSKIIPLVRKRMSEIVLAEPQKYLHIFGDNKQDLEAWANKIKRWSPKPSMEKWGGATEFEIFAQITGICVHVINKEKQDVEPPVQHFLPRSVPRVKWEEEDWTVRVVVVFGYEHYQVLVPPTLPNDVQITEGTTDSKGLEALIEIPSDGEEGDFAVRKKGNIKKFFQPIKRQTQRKLKEEKKAKKKSGTLDKFVKVSKKGNVQYLSPKNSEFSDPDDPGVPKIKILKDTESKLIESNDEDLQTEAKTNPGVTKRKDKDKDKDKDKEKEDTESMLIESDDEDFQSIYKDKYKEKKKEKKKEEQEEKT